jgi:hypothetical protein
MPTIKVKTKSGFITDMTIDEIIEIDGKPYAPGESLADRLAFLEGRVSAIETIFTRQEEIPTNGEAMHYAVESTL